MDEWLEYLRRNNMEYRITWTEYREKPDKINVSGLFFDFEIRIPEHKKNDERFIANVQQTVEEMIRLDNGIMAV